jgi:pimeloyl-ACP methyl ester carboxylesterase
MLSERVAAWAAAGEREPVGGHELFVVRRPGAAPTLLLLHGFPSSSYDWRLLLDRRPDNAIIAFDCLGFGLSDKPKDHIYSLSWQADAAEELVRRAGSPPVLIVAHDMGTSVATELLARDLERPSKLDIAGALLFNGSILLDRASLTLGQRLLRSPLGGTFARLTTAAAFRRQFSQLFSEAHPLGRDEADDQWSLIAHAGGHRIAHRTIYYLNERERLTDRWHGAFRDWPGPLSLAWGLRDPVATTAVLNGLKALRPGVPVTELPDAGHYPQIEQPELVAQALDAALASV